MLHAPTLPGGHGMVLYDPGMDRVRAWKPAIAGIREVLHAEFTEHAYPRHTHDDWTVFIVDAGAIRYGLDRRENEAPNALVSILPPGVAHDGRPASAGGYRKRVLYVDTSVLPESLIGPAVDRPAVPDPRLAADVAALHDALACVDDRLDAEARFADVADRIRASFEPEAVGSAGSSGAGRDVAGASAAEALRGYLDAHLFENVALADAANVTGWSVSRLACAFRTRFGMTPHAYVTGRRLDAARDRILAGQSLSDVAAEVGFCDQAHLTRRFRQFLATTPGRFAA